MEMVMMQAAKFAAKAHAGQVRKYTGEPYVCHCFDVAEIVSLFATPAMMAAAILHDTVEDTEATIDDLTNEFGSEVSSLVYWLSDKSIPSDGNRAIRKRIDREHISQAPPEAKTIKLADLISNTHSITMHDANFAKVYLAEKRLLLEVLTEGEPFLWRAAYALCRP